MVLQPEWAASSWETGRWLGGATARLGGAVGGLGGTTARLDGAVQVASSGETGSFFYGFSTSAPSPYTLDLPGSPARSPAGYAWHLACGMAPLHDT